MAASGAAVVAEMADVGRGVRVGRAAADAPLRVGRVLQLGRGVARVVEPENHGTRPFSGDLPELRVVAVGHEQRLRREAARHLAPALGQRARARRSGRAGRETGCRARRPAARRASPPRAARPRPPRTAPARHPGRRRAPRRRRRRGSRRRGCAPAAPTARGSARPSRPSSSCRWSPRRAPSPAAAAPRGGRPRPDPASRAACPGKVVPPPAPARRERPAAARARPISRASGARTPPRYRADLGVTRSRELSAASPCRGM